MIENAKEYLKALKEQRKYYSDLSALAKDDSVKKLFERDKKLAIDKMIWTFAENNVKSWEDFVKVRAEVASLLARIQDVYNAKELKKSVQEQIDTYYGES